ncbi:hypothetical protein Bpro_4752 [Polaromonas sp. JS666]|nr:hypothetical protein Bpro_4752 [Polaromonas sp. JS666]
MVSVMRILPTLLLLSASMLVHAQATRGEQDALALAIKSQQILNEYSVGAVEPEAMKYAQRLKLTKAALDGQHKQWPTVADGSPDPSDRFRACKSALEQASAVAGLSGMKATRTLDDQVFHAEKGKLQTLRSACDEAVKRAGLQR